MADLIQSLDEQRMAAKNCGYAFCCLTRQKSTAPGLDDWTWVISKRTNSVTVADDWWESQHDAARVWTDRGLIRNAK